MKLESSNLNWRSIFTNRRFLVWSVVSGLILVVTVFSGVIPQLQTVLKLNDELQVAQKQVQTLRTKASDLENIEARESYQERGLVNQILPSRKPLLELLAGLNSVATKNRVVFTDFSLSPGEISSASAVFLEEAAGRRSGRTGVGSNTRYETMPLELEIEGQFADVQQFFLDLEQMAPLVTITSLSLNIRGDEGMVQPDDSVQAELLVLSYYFTQSVEAALEKPLPLVGRAQKRVVAEIKNYTYPSVATQERIISGGFEDIFGLEQQQLDLGEVSVATPEAESVQPE